jgi:hypothetical protein
MYPGPNMALFFTLIARFFSCYSMEQNRKAKQRKVPVAYPEEIKKG